MIRRPLVALATLLLATKAYAVDWDRHEALTETGRPLLVAKSDKADDYVSAGETIPFFTSIAADGARCDASDGDRPKRIRVVCNSEKDGGTAVYIGTFIDAGRFLIQKVAVNKRMLPAEERVAHVTGIGRKH